MFDPTCFVVDGRYGYIMRHEGADYTRRAYVPLSVRVNPLRLEIGIGRGRPCGIILNRGAWMHLKVSNFLFRMRHRRGS